MRFTLTLPVLSGAYFDSSKGARIVLYSRGNTRGVAPKLVSLRVADSGTLTISPAGKTRHLLFLLPTSLLLLLLLLLFSFYLFTSYSYCYCHC